MRALRQDIIRRRMRSAARGGREAVELTASMLIDLGAAVQAGQGGGQQQENRQKVDAAAAHESIIGSAARDATVGCGRSRYPYERLKENGIHAGLPCVRPFL